MSHHYHGDKPQRGNDLLDLVVVECGQCMGCRLKKATEWAVRSTHEAMSHERNCFITLTYNNEHLGDPALDLRDFQLFMKRLRKSRPGQRIKYLHSGEYGETNGRKHFHALLFGEDFSEDRKLWKPTKGGPLFTSQALQDAWTCPRSGDPIGFTTIGTVSFTSAAYVARYALKKRNDLEGKLEYPHALINAETGETEARPPYSTMSRRPGGLGKQYFDKHVEQIYENDFCVILPQHKAGQNARKFPVPRYYDKLLKDHDQVLYDQVKAKRIANAEKRLGREDRTEYEVNNLREEIALARLRLADAHREHL